jgi:predicted SAM-dependent methyltransferase
MDSRLAQAAQQVWKEFEMACISRRSAARFQQLRHFRDLKVHLGCGADIRLGWINIDLSLHNVKERDCVGDAIFINHDLRRGLPLEKGSCELIYSSHFFEHLDWRDGERLMRDCFSALKVGGLFRIVLPDMPSLFQAYLSRDADVFSLLDKEKLMDWVEPATRTFIDYLNYCIYQHGEHKCIYDSEKLQVLLRHIGFSRVEVSSFSESTDLGTELRRAYSFYTNAWK